MDTMVPGWIQWYLDEYNGTWIEVWYLDGHTGVEITTLVPG